MTLYQSHCEKWRNGCGSDQCAGARHRVFARGSVPCDVLFVGEAPGESEDVLAKPFIGPAGKLLDEIIARVMMNYEATYGVGSPRVAFTNLVMCIPRDDVTGTKKATEPDLDQIKACRPRLTEFIEMCDPKLIVCVGVLAGKHVPGFVSSLVTNVVTITHPAAIIRANLAQQGLMVRRVEVNLTNALEELQEK